uniref:Uncharacterized protein n=1 Tax=Haemonchus contortus TaxID=6289 RepID=A0A7I4XVW7_HAECO
MEVSTAMHHDASPHHNTSTTRNGPAQQCFWERCVFPPLRHIRVRAESLLQLNLLSLEKKAAAISIVTRRTFIVPWF